MTGSQNASIFFFAHQDDEFGVFQQIIDERLSGCRVFCAYLTDGGCKGATPERRNRESVAVLTRLGVEEDDVFFAGQELSIGDAQLPKHLELAAKWVSKWLSGFSLVESIYVPAWEGGHHDHDAVHAITVAVAQERGVLSCVRQFPLYNGYGCAGPLFRVFFPLPLNGEIVETTIPWRNRLRFLRYCLFYSSQAKTWVGLLPFVLFYYLTSGVQQIQSVTCERIHQRPHDGPLYYERRGFFTWERMIASLSAWQSASLIQNKK